MKTIEEYMKLVIDVATENKDIMDRYIAIKDIGMETNSIKTIIVQEFNLNSVETFNTINSLINYFYKKVSFIENILDKYKSNNIINDIFYSKIIQKEVTELFLVKEYITFLRKGNTLKSLLFFILTYRGCNVNGDTIKFIDDIYYINVENNVVIKL